MQMPDLSGYYEHLRNDGLASLTVILKAAPGDDSFVQDDPVANVTVTAEDPATGKISTKFSQMSARSGEFVVEIPVLTVVGVLEDIWGRIRRKPKPAPKPYHVTITVEPHPDWKDHYTRKVFPLEAQAGSNPRQHVWMMRTGSGHAPDRARRP